MLSDMSVPYMSAEMFLEFSWVIMYSRPVPPPQPSSRITFFWVLSVLGERMLDELNKRTNSERRFGSIVFV